MFAELGQAPKSLKLDLSTYEDSWTHVAAFRREAGWLLMAQATIQSEHDLITDRLVVACFDHGEAIPSWRAVHLTQCHWHGLEECWDQPPELLDDLLCEEEGAFYLRWQRETNAELAALHERMQRQLEILEARNRAHSRRLDRQIAELRQRRRSADASPDARNALSAIIRDLEAELDEAAADYMMRRRRILQRAEVAEEAMWLRDDVLFEVEPLCLIQWQAGDLRPDSHAPQVWRGGRYFSQPRALAEAEPESEAAVLAKLRTALEQKAKQAKPDAPAADPAPPASKGVDHLPKASPIRQRLSLGAAEQRKAPPPPAVKSKEVIKLERRIRSLNQMLASLPPGSQRWSRTWRFLEQNKRQLAALEKSPGKDKPQPSPPAPTPPTPSASAEQQLALPVFGEDLLAERATLLAELKALELKGQKFLPGSPKTKANLAARGDLECRIAALDRQLAEAPKPASGVIGEDNPWTPERVALLTAMWSDGQSANAIAAALGGTSRNAVIGKAKRLGLPFNYGKQQDTEEPA